MQLTDTEVKYGAYKGRLVSNNTHLCNTLIEKFSGRKIDMVMRDEIIAKRP